MRRSLSGGATKTSMWRLWHFSIHMPNMHTYDKIYENLKLFLCHIFAQCKVESSVRALLKLTIYPKIVWSLKRRRVHEQFSWEYFLNWKIHCVPSNCGFYYSRRSGRFHELWPKNPLIWISFCRQNVSS